MKYLGKQVNGRATRDNFIRSMDLALHKDPDAALDCYCRYWFSSTRKQYLNDALNHVAENSLFWPKRAFTDMVDEIVMSMSGTGVDEKVLARDADRLCARFTLWASPRKSNKPTLENVRRDVKAFEAKYRYSCPDTYKSCWMNTGAFVTLSYGIKYEGFLMPKCSTPEQSLSLLKKCAMEVVADMDHTVDDRLFRLCHALYTQRLNAVPGLN